MLKYGSYSKNKYLAKNRRRKITRQVFKRKAGYHPLTTACAECFIIK
jgi:hypothetical protein